MMAGGLGLIPLDPDSVYAPMWVLALCGFVVALGGIAMLAPNSPRIQAAAGVTFTLAMGMIGAWVAFFSDSDGFSGGIPFVPREVNVLVARGLFGLGAVMCLALFVWGARRILRGEEIQ